MYKHVRRFSKSFLPGFFLSLIVAIALFPLSLVYSQQDVSVDEIISKLRDLKATIEREKRHADVLEKKRTELSAALSESDLALEEVTKKKESLVNEKMELEKEEINAEQIVVESEKKLLSTRKANRGRMVALYKMYRETTGLDYLVKAQSLADLTRRAKYLERIASYDRARMIALRGVAEDFAQKKSEVAKIAAAKTTAIDELNPVERNLAEQRFEKASLLREAEKQEKLKKENIEKLRKEAGKLEAMMARLMGGDEEVVKTPTPIPEQPEPAPKDEKITPSGYEGLGLAHLKGKLPLPVDGQLVRAFGKQRHEEFEDVLFIKGLEFNAPVGSRVKSVSKGKVIFNEVLPGYGNVIILDHGRRYYSLYGQLASSMVKVGEEVSPGAIIAVVGESDKRHRNFYFELRIQGKAVNPIDYFEGPLPRKI